MTLYAQHWTGPRHHVSSREPLSHVDAQSTSPRHAYKQDERTTRYDALSGRTHQASRCRVYQSCPNISKRRRGWNPAVIFKWTSLLAPPSNQRLAPRLQKVGWESNRPLPLMAHDTPMTRRLRGRWRGSAAPDGTERKRTRGRPRQWSVTARSTSEVELVERHERLAQWSSRTRRSPAPGAWKASASRTSVWTTSGGRVRGGDSIRKSGC